MSYTTILNLDTAPYRIREAYTYGHMNCLGMLLDLIEEEEGGMAIYKELVDRYNQYVIDNDFFGVYPSKDHRRIIEEYGY